MEKEPYWVKFANLGLLRLVDGGGDGGGDGDEDPEDDDEDPDEDEDDEGAEELGDKGKRALERMKAKLKKERSARIKAEKKLAAGAKPPAAKDDADARAEAQREADEKANQRFIRAEVKAAAKGKLADPKDALLFLDLEQFEVDEDGEVDEDEIAQAIDELLERKPHLAAQGGARKPQPDPSQGAKGKSKSTPADQFEAAMKKQFGGR